jgi:hypothetical protein
MGKINIYHLDEFEEETINHQKIKKRKKPEIDDQNTEKASKTNPKK